MSRQFPAIIRGFKRRFWMRSADHRGTPENPGRVVTLVQSDQQEDCVYGVVYEISNWDEIIADLDYRERHGYTRTVARIEKFHNLEGENFSPPGTPKNSSRSEAAFETQVYFYDTENATVATNAVLEKAESTAETEPTVATSGTDIWKALVFGESVEDTAQIIATIVGPSGRNSEYLFQLCNAMREMCGCSELESIDPYLAQLEKRVTEIQAKKRIT